MYKAKFKNNQLWIDENLFNHLSKKFGCDEKNGKYYIHVGSYFAANLIAEKKDNGYYKVVPSGTQYNERPVLQLEAYWDIVKYGDVLIEGEVPTFYRMWFANRGVPMEDKRIIGEVIDKETKEELSDYAHDAWSQWMEYLFSLSNENEDGTVTIPKNKVNKWKRQLDTNYYKLSNNQKGSDRKEAQKMINIIGKNKMNENTAYNRVDIPKIFGWDVKLYQYEVRYIHKKTGLNINFDFSFKDRIKYDMKYNGGTTIDFIKKDNNIKTNIKSVLISIPFSKIDSVNETVRENKMNYKKGQKLTIDMGDGKEIVIVGNDFKAGMGGTKFITLNRKKGAPYTLSSSKLKKVIVEVMVVETYTNNFASWFTGTALNSVRHKTQGKHKLTPLQIKQSDAVYKDKLYKEIEKAFKTGDLTNKHLKMNEAKKYNEETKISNLYLKSVGSDKNGNWRIVVGFPNDKGFAIQTNNPQLQNTHKITKSNKKLDTLTTIEKNVIGKEITDYVKKFGSSKVKSRLKIYEGLNESINDKQRTNEADETFYTTVKDLRKKSKQGFTILDKKGRTVTDTKLQNIKSRKIKVKHNPKRHTDWKVYQIVEEIKYRGYDMTEQKLSKLQIAYQEFFKAMMDEFGVKSPVELKTKRSEFFNRVKKEWPAAKKKIQEGVLRQIIRELIYESLGDKSLNETERTTIESLSPEHVKQYATQVQAKIDKNIPTKEIISWIDSINRISPETKSELKSKFELEEAINVQKIAQFPIESTDEELQSFNSITEGYYEAEYYDIQGGHGGLGSSPSFKIAYKLALDLYKREKKDKQLGTSTGYIGVSGDGDEFAIIYLNKEYLANSRASNFKDKVAYKNWINVAKKVLQTGKPATGSYSGKG